MKPQPAASNKVPVRVLAALATIGLLLAGCVVTSVYPWYTAKDVVFNPALVGTWVSAASTDAVRESVRFERGEGDAYLMTLTDAEKSVAYDAHLFKLKGQLFLDYCPRERPGDFIPPHYVIKVLSLDPTFKLCGLDYSWLVEQIEKNPKTIRHSVVEGQSGDSTSRRIVLTAATAELQTFLLKHAANTNAFAGADELKRQ